MEKYYLAALKLIKGCGDQKIKYLLEKFKKAEFIWKMPIEQLLTSKMLTTASVESFAQLKQVRVVERLCETCYKQQINILSYLDAAYPDNLKQSYNFPVVLYTKGYGSLSNLAANRLAVVGPRQATAYGKAVVEFFIKQLALKEPELQIISGGAKGIDTQAHKSALQNGLTTIAVFGCGLDQNYPPENKRLFSEIQETGLIVSEYPPGTKPSQYTFPARNRIISGLSQGVILAEAPEKSGALITAELALENGREVYCVPGSIFSSNSRGVHNLIKQGAKLITNIEDILEDFCKATSLQIGRKNIFSASDQCSEIAIPQTINTTELDEKQKVVYNSLDFQLETSAEELLLKLELGLAELNLALLQLELQGLVVKNDNNKKYLKK